MRKRGNVLSSVFCPALHYFSTLSHKRHNFREKMLLSIKCVSLFSLQFFLEIFDILRRTERDVIRNVYWPSCKIHVILVIL